ncbi:MAG: hypothetical protein BGO49_01015 [Planctomycetales bacterium 71-10]|nr:MAG: hypothetical protein BGO49_01015 [Planctomycetales bacterium 71-10]
MKLASAASGLMAALSLSTSLAARAADDYAIDPAHTSVVFKSNHGGFASSYGMFDEVSGKFTIDPKSIESSKFELTIKVDSIDTGDAKRDGHLKSPDFFNAKQFPTITFKSTSVAKHEGGLKVVGDLTLHGVTKPVTLMLTGGKVGEFPPGVARTGYDTSIAIKRSDFGMDKMIPAVGDEVGVLISFEGTKP